MRSTTAVVRLWRREDGCWRQVAGPWRAHVGRNGLSAHHREGDGTTPAGTFRIGPTMYGTAPSPGVRYRYRQLRCGDWWDENPASPTYNTFRHVRCGAVPAFGADSDRMWLKPRAYSALRGGRDNDGSGRPRRRVGDLHPRRHRHSDERLHQPRHATASCELLRWLRPEQRPIVTIGTARTRR